MLDPRFKPGFRFTAFDALVVAGGAVGFALAWHSPSRIGFVIAFVIGHFFLFCNVFRVSRKFELAWSGVFLGLTICTLRWEWPGWKWTIVASLVATVAVLLIEIRKPSYHGIGWSRLNPGLPEWWNDNVECRENIR